MRTVSSRAQSTGPGRCYGTRLPAPGRFRPAQRPCPSWIGTIAATTVIQERSAGSLARSRPLPGSARRRRELISELGTHAAGLVQQPEPDQETCGGYSGYSEDTAPDNPSSPKPRTFRSYSEDTQNGTGDNGGSVRASYASGGGGASRVPRIAGDVTAGSALVSCVLVSYAPARKGAAFDLLWRG